jgi:choline dehydrogenase-like flavoprotein
VALSEALNLGDSAAVPPRDVAINVDRQLAQFAARGKWLIKAGLTAIEYAPLLSFRAPLSRLDPAARRRYLEKEFYHPANTRLIPDGPRRLVQTLIRIAKQMSYLGYYGDPRSNPETHYEPFTQRPDAADRLKASPGLPNRPLTVMQPEEAPARLSADVVILGSGAAGSILAHGLLEAGRDVLLVERGGYERPETFTENEAEMLGRLYVDGAFQLSRDFGFQVLQGSCLGGTTVVNNAVSFRIPPGVLDRWNDPAGYDTRLDPVALAKAYAEVEELIDVNNENGNLNPGGHRFMQGVQKLGYDRSPHVAGPVAANIRGCAGCGYCNLGCRYGRKLSMLDKVLPDAQAAYGSERFRILVGAEAKSIDGVGRGVDRVRCKLADGRRVDIRANTVVVASGAVSSSLLLFQSGIGGRLAGRGLAFNMGSPVTAVYPEPVRAFDGLQISHYLELSPGRGFLPETWFNPPVSQALAMPGWFDDHRRNMKRYDRLSSVGVLVASEGNGVVRPAGLTGRDIRYVPTRKDWETMLDGLTTTGEILFASGASSVMPHTFEFMEFDTPDTWRNFRNRVRDPGDMTLGTGHPQGGNALSSRRDVGVVRPDFRVFDYDNLFVCDASVFPTSIGVNPQLTVMALARHAVPHVAASGRKARRS